MGQWERSLYTLQGPLKESGTNTLFSKSPRARGEVGRRDPVPDDNRRLEGPLWGLEREVGSRTGRKLYERGVADGFSVRV